MSFSLSPHAATRAAQRNITFEEISFVMEHGTQFHRAGGIFYQLRQVDLPDTTAPNSAQARLVGTTVILCRCKRYVLTVYRNPEAFKKDRKKQKYSLFQGYCPYCQQVA